MSEKTIGEQRVRTEFNPNANSEVALIKQKAAELINVISSVCDGELKKTPGEVARLKSLAMTSIEEGAMWAVKAATA